MKYYKFNLNHDSDTEPILYLLEVSPYGFEQKKLEKYRSGATNLASTDFEQGTSLNAEMFRLKEYILFSLARTFAPQRRRMG